MRLRRTRARRKSWTDSSYDKQALPTPGGRGAPQLEERPVRAAGGRGAARLAEYGPNRIEEAGRRSLALEFLGQFTHFFALILWVAAGLVFFAGVHNPGQGFRTLG
jgi:hypothetical protein